MATYRTSDLLKQVHEISENGVDYVDIYEVEDTEEDASFLAFEGIVDEYERIEYDGIDSVNDIDNDVVDNDYDPDDPCMLFTFTYNELFTFACALDDALEFHKIRSASTNCCRDEKDDIKKRSIAMRNLQAKLSKKIKRSYK